MEKDFILIRTIEQLKEEISGRAKQQHFIGCMKEPARQIRLNFKANMVPWNQIFAQALGFRLNWDDPPDSFHPYHHLYRRTAYSHLETLLDREGGQMSCGC
ncbi:hypothetical protein RR48_13505 [Papilio machaon]|uniref:Uncharacterized protein n=1 Tax=Papilio machaon TaxID=76193 RepID=A0A194RAA3_PAPMA|nr:hypothetical protein RR48_13505 [Papilio machaon]